MLRVEFLRRKRGLTQRDVAEAISVNPASFCRFEQGKLDPKRMHDRTKVALMAFFKTSIDEMLETV